MLLTTTNTQLLPTYTQHYILITKCTSHNCLLLTVIPLSTEFTRLCKTNSKIIPHLNRATQILMCAKYLTNIHTNIMHILITHKSHIHAHMYTTHLTFMIACTYHLCSGSHKIITIPISISAYLELNAMINSLSLVLILLNVIKNKLLFTIR